MAEELPLKGVVTLEVSDEEMSRVARLLSGDVTANVATPDLASGGGSAIAPGAGEASVVGVELAALTSAINRLIAVLPVAVRSIGATLGGPGSRAPSNLPTLPGQPTRPSPGQPLGLVAALWADLKRAVSGLGRTIVPNTSGIVGARVGGLVGSVTSAPLPVKAAALAAGAFVATPLLAGLFGRLSQGRLDRLVGSASEFSPQLATIGVLRQQGEIQRAQIRGAIAGQSGIGLQAETNKLLANLTTIVSPITGAVNDVLRFLTSILNAILGPVAKLLRQLVGAQTNPAPALFDRLIQELGGSKVFP